ncbi:MAG: hypothetical protein ACYDCQ_16820 [Dehalococcoidia bacterium]
MARQIAPAGSDASIARIERLMNELNDLLGRYLSSPRECRDRLAESIDADAAGLVVIVHILLEQDAERREWSLEESQWLDDDDD